ncbi:YczE/YyaS/YitT family protein [Natronincola ferrireducens]|uniref:Uncharacterized membrane protein YczE n=1 Tax=Natronincola ferrireducens TaxID=393762 RepID=A0A1G9GUA4_9FIRM|nr:DUF6198 family protein [Natronincola ferrireducens]SDL04247.1 Uncharacterized membrane protein YczE [Natronincola ferrireducens]
MGKVLANHWKKEKLESFIKRCILYVVGLFVLALGVIFSVKSNLGVTPVTSIPYVLSVIANRDLGLVTTTIFTFYVFLQILILRGQFQLKQLLQIVCASIFGIFVTLANRIFIFNAPATYGGQVLFLLISIVLVAIGLLLYLAADIIPQPAEGLVLTIAQKKKIEFSKAKILFDITCVSLSILLILLTMGELQGIREGTLISAIGIGKVLGILSKRFKKYLIGFCTEKEADFTKVELE